MLRVVKEPDDLQSKFRCYESCCFCNKPTNTWVPSKDVACCKECAKTHSLKQVPSKDKWCEKNDL